MEKYAKDNHAANRGGAVAAEKYLFTGDVGMRRKVGENGYFYFLIHPRTTY
ncbi:MAG: hypothetical protein WBC19_06125 [Pyrinomonadaceae bacterium]